MRQEEHHLSLKKTKQTKKKLLILGNDKAETAAKAAGADTCLRLAGLWSKGLTSTSAGLAPPGGTLSWF